MRKILTILLSSAFLCLPLLALAQEPSDSSVLVVIDTPPNSPIIDREIEKGDLLEYEIRIKNNLGGKAGLYALVYDVDRDGRFVPYNDPSELDETTSLARWISFRRAVIEVESGQEVIQALKIRPAPEAKEGTYKAVIVLSRGSTQVGAVESAEKYNEAKINLSVTIKSHILEKAEIAEFKPVKPILTASPLEFSLKIKNVGNQAVSPRGEAILYTKGGRELASVMVEGQSVEPGKIESFPVKISFTGAPGRYKVKFLGEYGESNRDLQDVIYILYLPIVILSLIVVAVIGFLVWLTLFINKHRANSRQGQPSKEPARGHVINLKR